MAVNFPWKRLSCLAANGLGKSRRQELRTLLTRKAIAQTKGRQRDQTTRAKTLRNWLATAAVLLISSVAASSPSDMQNIAKLPTNSSPGGDKAVTTRPRHGKESTQSTVRARSTQRSRQCRERQRLYSQHLEAAVRALQQEVYELKILHNLRCDQSLHVRGSISGSLATIVRKYMTVFRHGIPVPLEGTSTPETKRHVAAAGYPLTPNAQAEFLTCIMDPYVEVHDWCGRFVLGANTLLNGWTAWAAWHDSLDFQLVDIAVVDTEDTVAVTTKANLCVRVSQKTIAQLFPHILGHKHLCDKLLGQEICYPIRDTFIFASNMRIIKYMCDIAFVDALLPVVGDCETVRYLMSPPDGASLNDLAVRTSHGDLAEQARLDVKFLLSEGDSP